jgi:hypothetical protein
MYYRSFIHIASSLFLAEFDRKDHHTWGRSIRLYLWGWPYPLWLQHSKGVKFAFGSLSPWRYANLYFLFFFSPFWMWITGSNRRITDFGRFEIMNALEWLSQSFCRDLVEWMFNWRTWFTKGTDVIKPTDMINQSTWLPKGHACVISPNFLFIPKLRELFWIFWVFGTWRESWDNFCLAHHIFGNFVFGFFVT